MGANTRHTSLAPKGQAKLADILDKAVHALEAAGSGEHSRSTLGLPQLAGTRCHVRAAATYMS